jgi:hypothetical protein
MAVRLSALRAGKVLSASGKEQIISMFCMNATGQISVPLFVFLRARINQRLVLNAPLVVVAVAQQNGR